MRRFHLWFIASLLLIHVSPSDSFVLPGLPRREKRRLVESGSTVWSDGANVRVYSVEFGLSAAEMLAILLVSSCPSGNCGGSDEGLSESLPSGQISNGTSESCSKTRRMTDDPADMCQEEWELDEKLDISSDGWDMDDAHDASHEKFISTDLEEFDWDRWTGSGSSSRSNAKIPSDPSSVAAPAAQTTRPESFAAYFQQIQRRHSNLESRLLLIRENFNFSPSLCCPRNVNMSQRAQTCFYALLYGIFTANAEIVSKCLSFREFDPNQLVYSVEKGRCYHLVHLAMAAEQYSPAVVLVLVENYRTLINSMSCDGRSLLHHAVLLKRYEAVAVLLRHKADVNARDSMNQTPIMMAFAGRDVRIIKLLLDTYKVALNARTSSGKRALEFLFPNNGTRLFEALLDAYDISKLDYLSEIVMFTSSFEGLFEKIISAVMKTPRTHIVAMHVIVSLSLEGNVRVVHNLVSLGILPLYWQHMRCAATQETLTHLAVKTGNSDVVRLFLNYNAPRDPVDNTGATPLLLAVKKGSPSIVRLVIAAGAEAHLMDAFDYGIEIDDVDMVREIVQAASKKGIRECTFNPFHTARVKNSQAVLQLLTEIRDDYPLLWHTSHTTENVNVHPSKSKVQRQLARRHRSSQAAVIKWQPPCK